MSDVTAGPSQKQIYKVALASIVGSVIEQFDFLVTGVIAATVWGGVFFKLPAIAAVAAAIGVYGIGIIIRPIGAYIFGNIADRSGRKDALVYALVLMGISTLLIGLTPSYDSIGIAAPVLLIIFRLLQGISFGAEFGTASTWVVEQAARSKHRAFWGAWVGFAIPIGLLLGFGSVILTKSLMTAEQFTAWGWRILFVVGFLVAIAIVGVALCGLAPLMGRGVGDGDGEVGGAVTRACDLLLGAGVLSGLGLCGLFVAAVLALRLRDLPQRGAQSS